uniref:Uncharacterized protein n=1 Tax=Panagrolaimus sp. JU765 TaxID=591449 RepID=A0AC34RK98_9BILA
MKERNIKPITDDVGFIKFVEENQNNVLHPKVDFDVLVNEIVEKEKKLAKGNCQETPLTDYFAKKQHEKTIRSKLAKVKNSPKNEKEFGTKKFEGKEKSTKETKTRFHGKSGENEKDIKEESTTTKPKTFEKKRDTRPPRKIKTEEKHKFESSKKSQNKDETTSSAAKVEKEPTKAEEKPAASSNKQKEDKNEKTVEKKEESATKKSFGPQKNKDRPERAIYQPGRGRKFYGGSKGKTTESEASNSTKQ